MFDDRKQLIGIGTSGRQDVRCWSLTSESLALAYGSQDRELQMTVNHK